MGQRLSGLGLFAGALGSGMAAAAFLGLAAIAVGVPTKAKSEGMDIHMSRILVCDTQLHAEVYARLMLEGKTPFDAVVGVNKVFRTEQACKERIISWRPLGTVWSSPTPNGRILVVNITIVTEMSPTPLFGPENGYMIVITRETRA
jgi:hypothetical protein